MQKSNNESLRGYFSTRVLLFYKRSDDLVEDAGAEGDADAVIGYGDISLSEAGKAVEHGAAVEHTSAAMDDQFILL